MIRVMSFILIIYLQRRRASSRGGKNAIVSNRMRDAIMLIIVYRGAREWEEGRRWEMKICVTVRLIIVGKSARGVMCSWLMRAIERPTPVSSLLHSSTIVMAGLIVIMYMRDMRRIRSVMYGGI